MPATFVPVVRAKRGKGPRTKKAARRLAKRRASLPNEWRDELACLFGVEQAEHDYRNRGD
jgi:hypothetical protein